jgi:TldD protein
MEIVREIPIILRTALKNGGDFAEIFIEERFSVSIGCEERKIERVISGTDRGAGIRVIVGDMTAYASTNDLSPKGLRDLAERVSAGINASAKTYVLPEAATVTFEAKPIKYPSSAPASDKAAKVIEANEVAWTAGKEIVQVLVRYGDSRQRVVIANSNGLLVTDERNHILFLVHSVARRGEIIQTGYEPVGGTMGFELFDQTPPAKVAQTAARQALRMLDAAPAPTGVMPVVISSEAGGTMIHEAVGHGLEADLVQKGLSVFSGKIGRKVASESVSVRDDATIPFKRGTFTYDDEGTPSQSTTLVENGILKTYMYDLITARKDGRSSTGNGRRESYRQRPIPRMTNTLIVPGPARAQDIISATDKGLFVRKMGGGQVNTVSGDFMFEVSEGYLISNGEIKEPVRGASLIGNSLKVLTGIDLVANDLGYGLGTCGKDGQGAPISDAQPTLRLREITVGGTSA